MKKAHLNDFYGVLWYFRWGSKQWGLAESCLCHMCAFVLQSKYFVKCNARFIGLCIQKSCQYVTWMYICIGIIVETPSKEEENGRFSFLCRGCNDPSKGGLRFSNHRYKQKEGCFPSFFRHVHYHKHRTLGVCVFFPCY